MPNQFDSWNRDWRCVWMAAWLALAAAAQVAADDPKPPRPYAELDKDGDGRLTLTEAFPGSNSIADRKQFFLLDADGDGVLNRDEWSAQAEHRTAVNLFRGYDANGDGEATEAELLEGASEARRVVLKQHLAVLDADTSGGLSLAEFSRGPGLVPRTARGEIDDPIRQFAEEQFRRVVEGLEVPMGVAQWQAAARALMSPLIPVATELWDRDKDGMVNENEVRAGIEVAYGVARAGGGAARFGDGVVFNEHFYRQIDRNNDRVLSGEELAVLGERLQRTAEQIAELDVNRDGRIDMLELDAAGLFQADTITEFLRWDANGDGVVIAEEFVRQARSYDGQIALRMIPAFDFDGDGRINFTEFLRSPLGDGSYFANYRREDLHHDGFLSRTEFFPSGELAFSGLADFYFDRLNRNGDGRLDLEEFWFDVGLDRISPAAAFRLLDRDGNGTVEVEEFVRVVGGSNPRRRFFLMDADSDGVLSRDEWERQGRDVPRKAVNLFRGYDEDGDGSLVESELLSGSSGAAAESLRQKFRAFDFDQDGRLALAAFSAIPDVVPSSERGEIPDSIVQLAAAKTDALVRRFPEPVTPAEWRAKSRDILPVPIPIAFELWDTDGDGVLSVSELQRGVELAYGVARQGGGLARLGKGVVFNEHFYRQIDRNGDRVLSGEELPLLAERWKQTAAQIGELDVNRDERIDMAELDAAGQFQTAMVSRFLQWDQNRDGFLDATELAEHAYGWENRISPKVVLAFDDDGDGRVSLPEFLASPLGDGAHFANTLREDRDFDGRLSLSEFFPEPGLPYAGLAAFYFERLDLNKDGLLDLIELSFHVRLDRMTPDAAFQLLDRDGDGTIEAGEFAAVGGGSDARRRFFLMDADTDGVLSREEWEQQGRDLPRKVVNLFRGFDEDEDGWISEQELLVGTSGTAAKSLRQRFVAFDFDRDGRLSVVEFSGIPDVVPTTERGEVPDAIVQLANAKLVELIERLPEPVPPEDWRAKSRDVLPAPIPLQFEQWDADRDGALSMAEMQRGVELAYGVARHGAGRARFGDGRVFNEHFYRQIDVNKDRFLSFEELPKLAANLKKPVEDLHTFDLDRDARLDMAELDAAGQFQTAIVSRFLQWDQNRDGYLDATELVEQARGWEDRIAPKILPAFDDDGDGRLSLTEFLASPVADGVYLGNELREDRDHDGRLSLAEFYPDPGLPYSGLAAFYFAKLDLNGDGFLDHREVPLKVDYSKLAPDVLVQLLDVDGDGYVSPLEAFGIDGLTQALNPRHAVVFLQLDVNADGMLSREELAHPGRLAAAAEVERSLRHEALPVLHRLDLDGDGTLTLEEWLTGRPAAELENAQRRFRHADHDADQRLTLQELTLIHGVVRSVIAADALDEHVEELVQAIFGQAGSDRSVAVVTAAVAHVAPHLPTDAVRRWDLDRDGVLHPDELRQGLDVLFGVREPDGRLLRDRQGRHFNARWFASLDKNRDGRVERSEFTSASRTPDELSTAFSAADQNHDGRLTLGEGPTIDWMWTTPMSVFRRLDADGDGRVSRQELSGGRLEPWETRLASWLFPAFDLDGDGYLSVREFQLSPLAIAVRTWDQPRIDADYDGRISRAEFHGEQSVWLQGLSALFFDRLDRDGDGSLSAAEVEFTVDLKQAPLEIVFRLFDKNQDGRLSLQETLEGRGVQGSRGWTMQTEDAFYAADADRNGVLSPEEFTTPEATVGLLATARPLPPKPRGGRRPATAASAAADADADAPWDFKMIGLITFNVLLVGGLAWVLLRTPAK